MPLPVAHGLIGASVVVALRSPSKSQGWGLLLLGALLGICPDFDYGLNWLPIGRGGWHHGFTHSFAFALVVGIATALVLREWNFRSVITFAAAPLSHSLLDFLMTESRGVALFWPFTNWRYRMQLFSPIDYTWNSARWSAMIVDLVQISLVELVMFGSIFLIVMVARKRVLKRVSS
jgi:membrane-bound metal-dependent hydrolase YbcI (DUF457 family)